MEDYDYNNNGYNNFDGYDNYGSNDNGYNNNIVEELEYELQLLWTTFLSLYTELTSAGQKLDKLLGTSTTQTPFAIAIFDSASSGGYNAPVFISTTSLVYHYHHHR